MGSFVPWLYYSFYCSPQPRLIYLSIVCVLGISAIIVAQWDRFATPKHRQTRAGEWRCRPLMQRFSAFLVP
jgi:adiponectin receptor